VQMKKVLSLVDNLKSTVSSEYVYWDTKIY